MKKYRVEFYGQHADILSKCVQPIYENLSDAREIARAVRTLFGNEITTEILSRESGSERVRRINPFPTREEV